MNHDKEVGFKGIAGQAAHLPPRDAEPRPYNIQNRIATLSSKNHRNSLKTLIRAPA